MNQRTATTALGLGKDPDPSDTKYQRKPSKPVSECEELDRLYCKRRRTRRKKVEGS
jgi:hypothetical protein